MDDLFSLTPSLLVVYASRACPDCIRALSFLDSNHIPYRMVSIENDEAAAKFLESLNRGYRSVPTLIFPDGSRLVEPSLQDLAQKFRIEE